VFRFYTDNEKFVIQTLKSATSNLPGWSKTQRSHRHGLAGHTQDLGEFRIMLKGAHIFAMHRENSGSQKHK
jgi:hypothetical protein